MAKATAVDALQLASVGAAKSELCTFYAPRRRERVTTVITGQAASGLHSPPPNKFTRE